MGISTSKTNRSALGSLRELTKNSEASFHEGQERAISLLASGGQCVICVQRTGWGKSAVYFVATHLLRDRGAGPTVIVSPLLALMRNQIGAAKRLGIRAQTINSSNTDDWDQLYEDLAHDRLDVLLISPERLANRKFKEKAAGLFEKVGLFVVDEAHCISDWGHDFRPDYRRLKQLIRELPADASILCTTATANNRVVKDIHEQLTSSDRPITEIRGPLGRASLRLEIVEIPSREEKLAWLVTHLHEFEGAGIIYCSTIRDAENVHEWLREHAINSDVYHGKMQDEDRARVESALLNNELNVLVATTALGMGYDKPDLSFVIHFQCPGSTVAYYQQVGRAGRALAKADGILLRSEADFSIQDFFINTAIPPRAKIAELLSVFERIDRKEATLFDFQMFMNLGQTRIRAMLTMLEVEGVVERGDGLRWTLINPNWPYDDERFNALTQMRQEELDRMRVYGTDGRCLMQFLRTELDDVTAEPCGRCQVCAGGEFQTIGDAEALRAAAKFLKSRSFEIEPRKKWSGKRSGSIPPTRQAETGMAISRYMDGAYGDLVADGKYRDGAFSDELLSVAIERVREWDTYHEITWVAAVPSLKHPELVPEFAAKLAVALGIPFSSCVTKTRSTKQQKELENSYTQAANVFEAFSVDANGTREGAVLLVDDMCDSRWTMTEIAHLLREAGSGPVYPFALADSSNT